MRTRARVTEGEAAPAARAPIHRRGRDPVEYGVMVERGEQHLLEDELEAAPKPIYEYED